jgi:DnaJ like chaperone protein
MGFKGIAIGGCIGSLYGPFGAILGALAGEYFERRMGRLAKNRAMKSASSHPLDRYYKILGSKRGDDFSTLQRRYRDLVKKRHPDVLRAQGASEKEVARATEQMSEINAAWAVIQKDLEGRKEGYAHSVHK